MQLQLFDGYAIYGPTDIIQGTILYGFDFDHTIIKPLRGVFYKTTTDWEFVPGMDLYLKKLHETYVKVEPTAGAIAIFTNQGGVKAGKISVAEVIARIDAVTHKLGFLFIAFIALSEQYRKPGPLLFEKLIYEYMPDYSRGFFVGDASGLDSDFSDTDYRFAVNCGLKYVTINQFQTICGSADIGQVPNLLMGTNIGVQLEKPCVRDYIVRTPKVVSTCVSTHAEVQNIDPPSTKDANIGVNTKDTNISVNISANTKDAIVGVNTKNANISTDTNVGIIVLLVGPPGCGKTTYTKTMGPEWTIISRDVAAHGRHATASQCLSVVKKTALQLIKEKKRALIVVDATHPDKNSREPFIKFAAGLGMLSCAIVFDVSIDIAKYINKIRTIAGGNHVPDIAYGVFSKRYTPPSRDEGFSQIIVINQIPQCDGAIPDEYFDLYL